MAVFIRYIPCWKISPRSLTNPEKSYINVVNSNNDWCQCVLTRKLFVVTRFTQHSFMYECEFWKVWKHKFINKIYEKIDSGVHTWFSQWACCFIECEKSEFHFSFHESVWLLEIYSERLHLFYISDCVYIWMREVRPFRFIGMPIHIHDCRLIQCDDSFGKKERKKGGVCVCACVWMKCISIWIWIRILGLITRPKQQNTKRRANLWNRDGKWNKFYIFCSPFGTTFKFEKQRKSSFFNWNLFR